MNNKLRYLFAICFGDNNIPQVIEVPVMLYSQTRPNDGWIAQEGVNNHFYKGYFFDADEIFSTPKLAIKSYAIKTRQRINSRLEDIQVFEDGLKSLDKIKIIRKGKPCQS